MITRLDTIFTTQLLYAPSSTGEEGFLLACQTMNISNPSHQGGIHDLDFSIFLEFWYTAASKDDTTPKNRRALGRHERALCALSILEYTNSHPGKTRNINTVAPPPLSRKNLVISKKSNQCWVFRTSLRRVEPHHPHASNHKHMRRKELQAPAHVPQIHIPALYPPCCCSSGMLEVTGPKSTHRNRRPQPDYPLNYVNDNFSPAFIKACLALAESHLH